jgi:hypothetical protein
MSDDIKRALRSLVPVPIQARICVVTSVDAAAGVCDLAPQDGTAPLLDVRLTATPGTPGLKLVPKVGSYVIAAHVQNNPSQAWLAQCSELERVELEAGGSNPCTLVIDSGGVLSINGGQLGGLVKVQALADALARLESRFNQLLSEYQLHTHVIPDGSTAPPISTVQPIAPPTTRAQLENVRVQQ